MEAATSGHRMRFRRRETMPQRYSWLASADRQETVLAVIGLESDGINIRDFYIWV